VSSPVPKHLWSYIWKVSGRDQIWLSVLTVVVFLLTLVPLELQRRVIQPTQKIVGARGISGVKYAMDCRGYYGGPARRPLLPLQETEKKDIESLLAAFAPAVAAT